MVAASLLSEARRGAGLSQRELAERAGTSQATISAYENGRKEPSVETLARLLAAVGARLAVEAAQARPRRPTQSELRRAARTLSQVLELAEALPSRPDRDLRYPRLEGTA